MYMKNLGFVILNVLCVIVQSLFLYNYMIFFIFIGILDLSLFIDTNMFNRENTVYNSSISKIMIDKLKCKESLFQ